MRVLLIQPEDSADRGPWTTESWDLLVDLGRSSPRTAARWSNKIHCPLLRVEDFTRDVEDLRRTSEILSGGDGRLLDCEEMDWWNLYCLDILQEAASVLALERMAAEISRPMALWSTRPGRVASIFARVLSSPLHCYGNNFVAPNAKRILQYVRLLRHFSPAQLKEIFLDKYDATYRWRARFARSLQAYGKPVVLIPSAYTNVSRVSSAYAKLLPEQTFLLVATRRSAKVFDATGNVIVRELGSYAEICSPRRELEQILQKWTSLSLELEANLELVRLRRLGLFEQFPATIAQGLSVRDAWRRVFERERVCGVLCGDDTNVNTRIPVLLASRRDIPTLDFHHGAMDGFYLAKRLCCDFYLAKNDLERDYLVRVCRQPADKVVVGAPLNAHSSSFAHPATGDFPTQKAAIVFFSEPYENVGMRTEEVYGELLPALCAVARQRGYEVVLKLHPFESVAQRAEVMGRVLPLHDRKLVSLASGPLSENLLSRTWAGVTIESTTVLDCVERGIPCFICEWLSFSPFGYVQQYAKFAAGYLLRSADEISQLPHQVAKHKDETRERQALDDGFRSQQIDPQLLAQLLGAESTQPVARSA